VLVFDLATEVVRALHGAGKVADAGEDASEAGPPEDTGAPPDSPDAGEGASDGTNVGDLAGDMAEEDDDGDGAGQDGKATGAAEDDAADDDAEVPPVAMPGVEEGRDDAVEQGPGGTQGVVGAVDSAMDETAGARSPSCTSDCLWTTFVGAAVQCLRDLFGARRSMLLCAVLVLPRRRSMPGPNKPMLECRHVSSDGRLSARRV
jgi:hypothetical protein